MRAGPRGAQERFETLGARGEAQDTRHSIGLIFRSVRAHKVDQRQRTLERIQVKSLSEYIPIVEKRILVDQLMLIRLLGKS